MPIYWRGAAGHAARLGRLDLHALDRFHRLVGRDRRRRDGRPARRLRRQAARIAASADRIGGSRSLSSVRRGANAVLSGGTTGLAGGGGARGYCRRLFRPESSTRTASPIRLSISSIGSRSSYAVQEQRASGLAGQAEYRRHGEAIGFNALRLRLGLRRRTRRGHRGRAVCRRFGDENRRLGSDWQSCAPGQGHGIACAGCTGAEQAWAPRPRIRAGGPFFLRRIEFGRNQVGDRVMHRLVVMAIDDAGGSLPKPKSKSKPSPAGALDGIEGAATIGAATGATRGVGATPGSTRFIGTGLKLGAGLTIGD